MRRQPGAFVKIVGVVLVAWCFQIVWAPGPVAAAQQPAPQAAPPAAPAPQTAAQPGRGRGPIPIDPRVQIRNYLFTDTNEEMPYAVFVSSKVRPNTRAPLVIALHGLGGTHTSLLRGNALDLAEEGGYILVGPMGYSPSGWYGAPAVGGPGRRGRGPAAPNPAGAPPTTGAPNQTATTAVAAAPPAAPGGRAVTDPARVTELSERDVLNVLAIVRREFNIDERRTYLMGHSMGGAGTLHLAVKHARVWAAAAAIAPAAFSLQPSSLAAIPEMPMLLIHGDADTVVPVTISRPWAAQMKQLNMTHQYIEVPGGDHGNVITIGMPDIFAFFGKHSKPASR
jgi:predicted esterase